MRPDLTVARAIMTHINLPTTMLPSTITIDIRILSQTTLHILRPQLLPETESTTTITMDPCTSGITKDRVAQRRILRATTIIEKQQLGRNMGEDILAM